MLNLRTVFAYACVGSNSPELLDRTQKVMWYLRTIGHWQGMTIFSPIPAKENFPGIHVIQIPEFSDAPFGKNWQIFLAKTLPLWLLSSNAQRFMFIHEDGFPTNPELWEPKFLDYDYIAAPWLDGVVGGGGMCMASRHFLEKKVLLPWYDSIQDGNNEDEYACRKFRHIMENEDVTFAPTALAMKYCTENNGNDKPSFGFHGRKYTPDKYTPAWEKVEAAQA